MKDEKFSALLHSKESLLHPGWVKGPDGWHYTHPHGEPPEPPPGYTYVWITAGDDRACPVCAPLHGRLFREAWTAFPPLHPNCRCSIALIPTPQ